MKDKDSEKKSDKEREMIQCPKCSEPVNIELNYLKKSNGLMSYQESVPDFLTITCQKCSLNFKFIICVYCKRKIFMKIHPKEVKYNGLNGYNIKCPYQSCEKIFYFTKCIKCKKVQKQKREIKEGSILQCVYCKIQYFQVNCPVKYCNDLNSFEKPQFHNNFPIGAMLVHNNEIIYQKINCYYCNRPIVFASKKNNKNKYYEAQKVICPYKNCLKSFNRIICVTCSEEIYINDGFYQMGSKIKCYKCKTSFGKILCVSCGKMNTCQQNFFKFGIMKCGFQNCLQENNLINCLYCRKLNIIDKKIQINGQPIKCGYCKNTFNMIICPYCEEVNPFPLSDFSFGKIYKCQYVTCMKEYQFVLCPQCHIHSFIKDKNEGHKFKCEECQTLFMNWGCPFCKTNIMDKKTTLQMGQMIRCPSETCKKVYSFIRCSSCQKLIFSKENENIIGKAVKCPNQNCKVYTLITYCPMCNIKSTYTGKKTSLNDGESILCENCKKRYIFSKNNTLLYKGNLIALKEIVGKTIDFGVGEVDENYLAIQELFFHVKSNIYPIVFVKENSEKNSGDKYSRISKYSTLGECIVCHNNLKESIFYPCGHRCVCYNCAVILFAVSKKCPKCNNEVSCIIKKIHE